MLSAVAVGGITSLRSTTYAVCLKRQPLEMCSARPFGAKGWGRGEWPVADPPIVVVRNFGQCAEFEIFGWLAGGGWVVSGLAVGLPADGGFGMALMFYVEHWIGVEREMEWGWGWLGG